MNDKQEEFLKLINELRTNLGLHLLIIDDTLTQIAQDHNKNMVTTESLNHDNFSERLRDYWIGVENVAWNQQTVPEVFEAWKDSPGHYNNMINPEIYLMGLNHYQNYWTLICSRKNYELPC